MIEILISLTTVFGLAVLIFLGSHFGGNAVEGKLRRGLTTTHNEVISVTPGQNAKEAEGLPKIEQS